VGYVPIVDADAAIDQRRSCQRSNAIEIKHFPFGTTLNVSGLNPSVEPLKVTVRVQIRPLQCLESRMSNGRVCWDLLGARGMCLIGKVIGRVQDGDWTGPVCDSASSHALTECVRESGEFTWT
jgi:hypothetical protein